MNRDESRRSKRSRVDRDYEMVPTSDLIVNDFDDERTLDEEEALEGSEDSHNELSCLQKEGDMPLTELLAKYGYGDMSSQDPDKLGEGEDEDEEEDEEDEDEDEEDQANYEPDLKQFYNEMIKGEENANNVKKPTNMSDGTKNNDIITNTTVNCKATVLPKNDIKNDEGTGATASTSEPTTTTNAETTNSIENINNSGSGGSCGSSRLLRSVSRPQSEEEEDDCDYSPDEEEWKKTIMVGSDYQAAIPEGLCKYDDALPYENEDKMLWDPNHIPEEKVDEFLEKAQPPVKGTILPGGSHIRDDEQALYLLLQCGYNLEEALRRRRINTLPQTESISLWSEEECHNFESGLRNYGKDFHLIQKNKVKTRSVGELVQFYYLWKKTERHDIFTYKSRLEKKKYALHPGITDYMDRFLEEQEGVRDRSSSPNVHCLLYGDAKRQRTNANLANHEEIKSSDNWDGTSSTTTATTSVNNGISDNNSSASLNPLNSSKISNQNHNKIDHTNNLNKKSENNQISWAPTTTITNIITTASDTLSTSSLLSSSALISSNSPHLNTTTTSNNITRVNEVVIRPPENILSHLPS